VGRQDVVHAHLTAAELAAVLTSQIHGAPVVSTRHIATTRGSTPLARLVGRTLRQRLALQIATSNYVARVIREPSTVLWNAVQSVDLDDEPQRHKTVLLLQRLEPEKATDVALRAWAASSLAAQGWVMQIAGDGSERGKLEELAEQLGVAGSVQFLGHVRGTKKLLSRTALLMATGSADAFGLSVAEAMALGTPVLASNGGAHRELLGNDGWMFNADDGDDAARKLQQAIESTEPDRQRYGSLLRERQRSRFGMAGHVDRLDDVYRDVIRYRQSSSPI
jgi:glycosyltransferase involved in cell wall biosynthesis